MGTKKVVYKVIQDKQVPLRRRRGGGSTKYPFADMKINSYFVALTSVAGLGNNWARTVGSSSKFAVRTVNGEIRIYRIE